MDRHSVTEYFKSFVNDFSNEISLMSDLKVYTNIVSYEDHMVIPHENGIGWDILIRMELLTPLLKWVIDHPLSENDVIRLGCDMCQALILCHKNNIIHRDIKAENIFVNRNGDFKLGDFGIARVVERTASMMSQKGTYTYMAPEVFKGLKYNETADIYSLGIVLYRFLNESRTPFLPMGNLLYTDRQIAQDRRMSGEQIPAPKHGSEKLKNIVLMAVNYDPTKRFQSARGMKNALEHGVSNKASKVTFVQSEDLLKKEKSVEKAEKIEDDRTVLYADEKTMVKPQKVPQNIPKKNNSKKLLFIIGGIVVVLIIAIVLFGNSTGNTNLENSSVVSDTILENTDEQMSETLQKTDAVSITVSDWMILGDNVKVYLFNEEDRYCYSNMATCEMMTDLTSSNNEILEVRESERGYRVVAKKEGIATLSARYNETYLIEQTVTILSETSVKKVNLDAHPVVLHLKGNRPGEIEVTSAVDFDGYGLGYNMSDAFIQEGMEGTLVAQSGNKAIFEFVYKGNLNDDFREKMQLYLTNPNDINDVYGNCEITVIYED